MGFEKNRKHYNYRRPRQYHYQYNQHTQQSNMDYNPFLNIDTSQTLKEIQECKKQEKKQNQIKKARSKNTQKANQTNKNNNKVQNNIQNNQHQITKKISTNASNNVVASHFNHTNNNKTVKYVQNNNKSETRKKDKLIKISSKTSTKISNNVAASHLNHSNNKQHVKYVQNNNKSKNIQSETINQDKLIKINESGLKHNKNNCDNCNKLMSRSDAIRILESTLKMAQQLSNQIEYCKKSNMFQNNLKTLEIMYKIECYKLLLLNGIIVDMITKPKKKLLITNSDKDESKDKKNKNKNKNKKNKNKSHFKLTPIIEGKEMKII